MLLNEGDAYNKRLWDLSTLRLNQLGLFDEIKEKDAITRTNDRDQTVDIDLQVKERGGSRSSSTAGCLATRVASSGWSIRRTTCWATANR